MGSKFLEAFEQATEDDLTEIESQITDMETRLAVLRDARKVLCSKLRPNEVRLPKQPADPNAPKKKHWKTEEKERRAAAAAAAESTQSPSGIEPPLGPITRTIGDTPPDHVRQGSTVAEIHERGIEGVWKNRIRKYIIANGPAEVHILAKQCSIPRDALTRILTVSAEFIATRHGYDLKVK